MRFMPDRFFFLSLVLALVCSACNTPTSKKGGSTSIITDRIVQETVDSLVALHGKTQVDRIARGVKQAATFWQETDGSAEAFQTFCMTHFIADTSVLKATFSRFESNLMLINGYLTELNRDLNRPLQLDLDPIFPVDYLFGEFSPGVHVNDDYFKTKIAFVALLNFRLTTLQERLMDGPAWSRQQWAETRLASSFSSRVPSEEMQEVTSAYAAADNYISAYNVYMENVIDENGMRLFPKGLKLISHWGLRDELKAQYDKPDGLARQQMIRMIMEKIIAQEIPATVIDNPNVDWKPAANEVTAHAGKELPASGNTAEANVRYTMWQNIFKAERKLDPYFPDNLTYIDRKFNREREIPEKEVEALLVSVLSSPTLREIGGRISKRLGRPLQPFDIWYNGFRTKSEFNEDELDKIVAKKYPTVASFQHALPDILVKLGFAADKAKWLADHVTVDPSRGAGHAMGAGRLTDNSHLRTRIPAGGMNYKGYNIAVHELGHNVEQTFSFQGIDHTLLRGVPNTAFSEGFAFVFQSRDLELLDVSKKNSITEALNALDVLWSTYEIAGVSLTDMKVWRWMYAHPDATPAELKTAVIGIAKEVWNTYFAPVFGVKDVTLLAIYSHMVDGGMYTPDYPMGHIIAFQIEQFMKGKSLAVEMERMCKIGSITPDLWMTHAVGSAISTAPLLEAAKVALAALPK